MLLYVHRNRKAHEDGKPRTATSTFTQLLNSDRYFQCGLQFVSLLNVRTMSQMPHFKLPSWCLPFKEGDLCVSGCGTFKLMFSWTMCSQRPELCERGRGEGRGQCPGSHFLSHSFPVPNKPCGFCGRKAPWKKTVFSAARALGLHLLSESHHYVSWYFLLCVVKSCDSLE